MHLSIVTVVAGAVGALTLLGCKSDTARGERRDGASVTKPEERKFSDDGGLDVSVIVDEQTPAERAVSSAVRARVNADEGLSLLTKGVSIVTKAGVVRLIGFAPNDGEKERLTRIAAESPGVSRVDNVVVVATSLPPQ